jgi:hypothetical protein
MSSRKFTFILGFAGVIALFSYIILASQLTALGYSLEGKEQALLELRESEGKLMVDLAHAQNPVSLEERSGHLGLVEIGASAQYLDTRASNLGLVQNLPVN